MKKIFTNCLKFLKKNKVLVVVFIIFLFELVLRFYQLDQRNPFGYDQVDNAWAAKDILVNHNFPLVGMVAKGNSGIYIGPIYYYLISIFYYLTNLNPIASALFAGVTSIFTFWTLFYFVKKLINTETAVIAVIINTFCLSAIIFDRVQWPVDFIPSMSLIIFYLLYKVLTGDAKKLIWLALTIGFMFSIHFTAIFFPIIVLLSLPLFPRNKETLKYILLSLPLFLLCLAPNIIYQLNKKGAGQAFSVYLNENYHGFHLRRVIQLTHDALIQFNHYLGWSQGEYPKYFALPIFFILFLYKKITRNNLIFCYLVLLWFVVPWFVFATYKGEISDYYFSINRFIVLMVLAFIIFKVWNLKYLLAKIIVVIVLFLYCLNNFLLYLPAQGGGLAEKEKTISEKIKSGEVIKWQWGNPESYIYYYLMRQKGIRVY